MSEADLQMYFTYAGGLSAVLGVVNLIAARSKKCRQLLAFACFALSGATLSYRFTLPMWVTAVFGAGTLLLLIWHAQCLAANKKAVGNA